MSEDYKKVIERAITFSNAVSEAVRTADVVQAEYNELLELDINAFQASAFEVLHTMLETLQEIEGYEQKSSQEENKD